MYKMDKKDIELYNIRMKMIKVTIGDSKYCSTCKKTC